MIHVFGLSYKIPDYCIRSARSILSNASEPIHFTLCDNLSKDSNVIEQWTKNRIEEGKIQRGLFYQKNIKGRALYRAYDKYPPDDSEDFFIFTDLDLVVPEGLDWIKITRDAMKDNVLAGFSLSLENYDTRYNGGHNDKGFGFWLMAVNRRIYDLCMREDKCYLDKDFLTFFKQHGKINQHEEKLLHLAFELWKDDKEYYQDKVAGIKWDVGNVDCEVREFKQERSSI